MSEYRFFLFHKILVVSINLLVLCALTLAMYHAAQTPEEFTLVFLKVFGGSLLPILIMGWGCKYLLRRRSPANCGGAK